MATQGKVVKIYDLKTIGFDVVDKQLIKINQDFENIKKAKQSAEGKILNTSDTAEIKKFSDEIARLKIREQELRVERQQMINEQKAGNIARQEELRLQKAKIAGNLTEEGSIVRIREQIRVLNGLLIQKNQKGTGLINFQNESLTIDQAVAKLKQLTAAEQEFRRQFSKDSTLVGEYTTGIVQAFKQMGLDELVGGQINRTKERLNSLNSDFDRLQKELAETKAAGRSTESIELQMIENRNEVIKLDTELVRLRTDLRGTGDVGNQVSTAIGKGFASLKGQIASFAFQFVGIAAIISKAQQGIQGAKLSSDATTDLQIQLGETADEADRLNESLRNINTRTTLLGLQEIANVALKAGVAKEQIVGVTEAIDKVKVAFGKDFGSVETGTETFAKLINIFFTDGEITGDRILKIGNAIRALANETVASVPFLTDFSGRMAGLKQIANVTLPDILGLGAGFEEFKQSAEVSSTTLVKLIPKIAQDVEKFAKIAGVANDEFRTLLTETPIEALLKVSEGLVAGRGDVEEFAKTLADAGLDAGRVTTIVATLGGKADVFRERIKRAGATIQDTGAIVDAFQKKNNNLAASMDRLNKVFSDFFASKTFQVILSAIAGLLLLIINNLPIIITLVTLLTTAWVAQNVTLISLRAQLILYNLGIGANLVLLNLVRVAQLAYNAALFLLNGVLAVVTASLRVFGITLTATSGPIGVLLTLAALLGTAFLGLSKALGDSARNIDKNTLKLRAMSDVLKEAASATAEQRLKAEQLVKVIRDLTLSEETRNKVLQDLIALDPIFQKALVDGKINYEKLTDALKEFNKNLLESATLQAAQTKAQTENQELQRLINVRTTLEERKAGLRPKDFSDLSEEEIKFLPNTLGSTRSVRGTASLFGIDVSTKEINTAIGNINRAIEAQKNLAEASNETATTLLANKFKTPEETKDGKTPPTIFEKFKQLLKQGGTEKDFKDLKDEITKRKGQLNVFSKEFKKLEAIENQIENILNPKQRTTSDRGSRLTGQQKDAFKDIDAIRDEELARLNKSLLDQSEFQRREREVIKIGEDGKARLIKERQAVAIRDEQAFLLEQLEINKKAIDDKLNLLDGSSAEERKQLAELNLEKVKITKDTNDKLFDLQAKTLKQQLDADIAAIRLQQTTLENEPTVDATAKAEAKLKSDQQILALQEQFNKDIDELEKQLAQQSLTNTKESADEIRKTKEQILQDQKALGEAALSDINTAGEKQRAEIIINYEKLRQKILTNDKLTASQREKALDRLAKIHNKTILSSELAQLQIEFEKIKKLYEAGLKSEEEFLDKKKHLEEKKSQFDQANIDLSDVGIVLPSSNETQRLLSEQLSKLFGFKEQSAEAQLLGNVITQTFELATEVMNAYFDAERDRIEENLQLQLERLDLEKEQVIARAQSQAEIESLEKQFAARKRKAEIEAGEKLKKTKKSEAKIAFATELANIAVQASQYPFPASLVIGGILAALAAGRYALRVAEINREKFAFGGQPGEVPTKGGKFGGKPHSKGGTKFSFKGKEYEAEVDELAVIRTKNAPKNKRFTVTGTQTQIASAINKVGGGKDFSPGAKVIPHKENFINNVKAKFGFGGKLKEKKDTIENKRISVTDTYSKVIDKVMSEDKSLVETKNVSEIISRSMNLVTKQKLIVENQKKTTEIVSRLVNEKINSFENKVFKITGTADQVLSSLDPIAKVKRGGVVPLKGGEFGGKKHKEGGTDFYFRNNKFNAEVKELAVIRTKDAPARKKFTVTGDQMQIASFANKIGGGIDFKPGAKIVKFDFGGTLGDVLQPPVLTTAQSGAINSIGGVSDEKMDELIESNRQLAEEQSKRIDRLEVIQKTSTVSTALKKEVRQSSIGTL